MSRCDDCGEEIDERPHTFAGYGYYSTYHPACCPRKVEDVCLEEHPDDVPGLSAFVRDCWDRLDQIPARVAP